MLAVTVKDGTNAGRKILRTRQPWLHECATGHAPGQHPVAVTVELPGHRYSCPVCGTRRPTTT